jgi:hypothetical protein
MGGDLSPMEQACLKSFAAQGFDVTLFAYDEVANVPPGLRRRDAAEIVDRAWTQRFIYRGKPDLSHFSDYFRYKMFEKSGLSWLDSDVVLIDPAKMPAGRTGLVGRERQGTLNGAVLYVADLDLQKRFLAEVETLDGKDLSWGQTGPLLLDRYSDQLAQSEPIHGPEVFYPIYHDGVWKAFLPEHRAWCDAQCRSAATLHLFNNVLVRMGYWKSIAPPVGSYLHGLFQAADTLRFFEGTYPETVMRHLAHNFVASHTGEELGLKAVLTQLLPSATRSFNRHAKAIAAKTKPAQRPS